MWPKQNKSLVCDLIPSVWASLEFSVWKCSLEFRKFSGFLPESFLTESHVLVCMNVASSVMQFVDISCCFSFVRTSLTGSDHALWKLFISHWLLRFPMRLYWFTFFKCVGYWQFARTPALCEWYTHACNICYAEPFPTLRWFQAFNTADALNLTSPVKFRNDCLGLCSPFSVIQCLTVPSNMTCFFVPYGKLCKHSCPVLLFLNLWQQPWKMAEIDSSKWPLI